MNAPPATQLPHVNGIFLLSCILLEFSTLVVAIALPLRYMFRTQNARAILWMWLSLFVWSVLVCLAFPLLIGSTTIYKREVFDIFPEPPGVAVYLIAGWMPATIICSIGYVIHWLWNRICRRKPAEVAG